MEKKPKKIPVDKDFLDLVLKKINELEKKVSEKPSELTTDIPEKLSALPIITNDNYLFQCHALAPYTLPPEKQLEFNMKVNEFGKELEILMKKYNFIRSTGEFFAKNIN